MIITIRQSISYSQDYRNNFTSKPDVKVSNTVESQELKKNIATDLPRIVLACRAKNTVKKYQSYFSQWKRWCALFPEVHALPANKHHAAIYICSLIQNNQSDAVVESVFYAIQHFYRLNLHDDSFQSPLCENIVEAAKRLAKRRVTKKEPITVDHLRKVYGTIGFKTNCFTTRPKNIYYGLEFCKLSNIRLCL